MTRLMLPASTACLFSFLTVVASITPAAQTVQGGSQAALPAGDGKAAVEEACAACHTLDRVTQAGGHSAADWRLIMDRMMTAGAKLPVDQVPVVTDYLIRSFPETAGQSAVLLGGQVKVTIKEWDVPTKGSRPHDPLSTPDGAIWYTGQVANVLGRLDPKTGVIKEFTLPERSGPHGLVADSAGNIWYTANAKAAIGKLDPKTGQVTEYPTPGARDPHTPIFDQKGILWFTAQGANMVGRLDPATGDVTIVTSPTPRSNPYGIVVSSKGIPFFVEFGTNKVASIDPQTMAIREYPLPNPDARPRRIAITDDDMLWYADYRRGYLGRLDPATGTVTEWPSPSGAASQPYGITAHRGVIWYSESGVRPNTIVRFDPKTEAFQTWGIPSGGGVIRNMMATKDGDLVIACSGVNKIGLVDVE